MTHGVPVIGSNVGGITDIVTDGETGLLVPPGDAEALAAAITRLKRDPALAARLRAAGPRHVRESFTWDGIVAKWEAVYREALTL
jgi:glycosyltransferase involved in cell wall biosynthesis